MAVGIYNWNTTFLFLVKLSLLNVTFFFFLFFVSVFSRVLTKVYVCVCVRVRARFSRKKKKKNLVIHGWQMFFSGTLIVMFRVINWIYWVSHFVPSPRRYNFIIIIINIREKRRSRGGGLDIIQSVRMRARNDKRFFARSWFV